ncbi:hypothetical protein TA3x_003899 [Tundrisphaera sp. TA3]|uniref:hypothetical protein n=1 Tax=Tundrisphaera sp. TA3 TaxID=3435775 RepID=UPI003EBC2370
MPKPVGLLAICLATCAGCQQDPLPTAPPPVVDRFSGKKPESPEVPLSPSDQNRKYKGEAGPSASED